MSPLSPLVLVPGPVDSPVEGGLETFESVDFFLVEGFDVVVVGSLVGISDLFDPGSDAIVPLLAPLCVVVCFFVGEFLDVKIEKFFG